ncbi:hypothetical protein ACHAW6_000436, partial [Cyclotella cf. meneghiniana]
RSSDLSAFLYVPLLAWDLNTFAGGLFSSLLSNFTSDPCVSSTDLIQSSQLLLTARLIQVLAVPGGFLCTKRDEDNVDDSDDDDDCWDDAKKKNEANAINNILSLCKKYLPNSTRDHRLDDSSLLQSVGNAILPFGRSLILLLRASTSIIRQRKRRVCSDGLIEETAGDEFAFNLLENPDIMASEDGLKLLECFGAPLPSDIMKTTSSQSSWHALVDKWLKSFVAFESFHGTRGRGLVFDVGSNSWVSIHDASSSVKVAPSVNGSQPVGPGPRGPKGDMFEYTIANSLMRDLSHLGMIHIRASPMNCLVKLPKSFVELYGIVNRVKGREGRPDDTEDDSAFETAICLLTGTVMRSGAIRRTKKVSAMYIISTYVRMDSVTYFDCFTGLSTSRNMYFARKESWIWYRDFLPCAEMHSSFDAQQQIGILSKSVCR